MLISVIIPSYNSEKTIERCINSVVSQTYKSIEVIIVDDGSSDSSPDICDNLACKYVNVRVIHQMNGGPNSARNIGLSAAKGEYITFVDADDEFYSNDTIERNIRCFDFVEDLDIVSFPQYRDNLCEVMGAEKYLTKEAQFKYNVLTDKKELFLNWITGHIIDGHFPGKIFRKSLFEGWKLVEHVRFTEDHYNIPDICARCRKVVVSGIGGYIYKNNPESAVHSELMDGKRKDMLLSKARMFNYLRSIGEDGNVADSLYGEFLEQAYYLYDTEYYDYAEREFKNMKKKIVCSPLPKLQMVLSLTVLIFGLNNGIALLKLIFKVFLQKS